jgi:hypothetical protein
MTSTWTQRWKLRDDNGRFRTGRPEVPGYLTRREQICLRRYDKQTRDLVLLLRAIVDDPSSNQFDIEQAFDRLCEIGQGEFIPAHLCQ